MKERIKNIILSPSVLIACLLVLLIAVSFNTKGTTANNSTYPSDDVVNNLASTIASEGGCGKREYFVYQLIWGAIFMNNYDKIKGINTPITTDSMCEVYSYRSLYSSAYCYYTFDKLAANRGGSCTQEQIDQLKLAAKMVLLKNFTIPKNIYMAAEKAIIDKYGISWISYTPTGGWTVYYAYEQGKTLATTDIYGNTVRTDEQFYHNLADCLYEHPNLNNAYNQCDGTVPTEPTKYTVYLYPNGGTGITEGQAFEYTGTADFSTFPKVTKEDCILDGWNVGSPTGKEYNFNVDKDDDGEKLYARWDCETNTTLEHTVTFKLEKDTTEVFEEKKISAGKKVSPPTNEPTKENYVLQGWETDDGEVFNFNNKITKDLTLYAIWEKKTSTSPKTEEPKTSSSTTTNSNTTSKSPDTGLADYIIIVLLIIPALLGVIYYYKYYIKSNRES